MKPDSNKPFKILFDAFPLRNRLTGLGQFCFNLLHEYAAQAEKNIQFTAFIRAEGIQYLSGLPIKILKAGWLRRYHQPWMKDFIFERYDIWHASNEASRIIHIPENSKLVFTIHGLHCLDEGNKERMEKELKNTQSLADKAAIVVTDSEATTRVVKKNLNIPDNKLRRIYLGVNLSNEFQKPAWADGQKFIFAIGSFLLRKNFHTLIPMIKELPYKLVIAGRPNSSYYEQVRQDIVKYGVENQVIIPGEISDTEKNWCYQHCEAFAFPSFSEGFGIPIIEALYFGKPTFLSRFGSLPEIGSDYAYYWDNFSPQEMAQKVKENIDKPMDLEKCKAYALSYSWANTAKEYLAVYRSLLP